EVPFDTDRFMTDVLDVFQRFGRCVVAVSEGVHDADGTPIAEVLAKQKEKDVEKDPHGNIQLSGTGALGDFLAESIREKLGPKSRVRADTFGYLQRCCAAMASPVDQREAFEVGAVAARLSMEGDIDGSVSILRTSDDPYTVGYERVALEDVAAKTRQMPAEFLGDVIGAFSSRGGRVLGIDTQNSSLQGVRAEVTLAKMFGYATTL
ncbi:MAG: hypothetical protein JJ992_17325, partial [Planctomycetes bacterium]|nr:hypothetical protein [Planctomycetota bacterium]